jgi:hypothetical protein
MALMECVSIAPLAGELSPGFQRKTKFVIPAQKTTERESTDVS